MMSLYPAVIGEDSCFVLLKNDSMVWGERERGRRGGGVMQEQKEDQLSRVTPTLLSPQASETHKNPLVFCGRNDELKARNMFRQL